MPAPTHRYATRLDWSGSTGGGYEGYQRTHRVARAGAGGLDAARARLDVLGYTADAVAEMPEDDPPLRVTTIVLRPVVTVRAGERSADEVDRRVRHLLEVAHRECFIARSLTSDIRIEAEVTVV